ncbi:MAG: antitoxin [Desulfobulbaceae bacterium S3730MH12]|nr:MAG: antitoxin [Desulfobulbaceae bacterium S3730MH12]
MNTKLTLRLDDHLIKSAKEYSAQTGKSVSKIVSDFFTIIKNEKLTKNYSNTPTVQSLKGILSDAKLSDEDYKNYLDEKYL